MTTDGAFEQPSVDDRLNNGFQVVQESRYVHQSAARNGNDGHEAEYMIALVQASAQASKSQHWVIS